jgi:hypothetical protein
MYKRYYKNLLLSMPLCFLGCGSRMRTPILNDQLFFTPSIKCSVRGCMKSRSGGCLGAIFCAPVLNGCSTLRSGAQKSRPYGRHNDFSNSLSQLLTGCDFRDQINLAVGV